MPTYEYVCDNCEHQFEIYQSIHDDSLTKCSECNKNKLRRIIFATFMFIKSKDGKHTLGSIAEENSKKMGKELVGIKKKERTKKVQSALKLPKGASRVDKSKMNKPWYRTGDKALDVTKIKNVKKFIEEGNSNG